jgi:hypothetical protein
MQIGDDPVLSALWRYWEQQRGSRAMPRRRDIDPVEIPRLLPHLLLIERAQDGRYRYRLAGTAVVDAYGRELTGRLVDEVIPAPRRAIAERHYSTVFTTSRPIFVRNKYAPRNATEFVVSRIVLPLSTDDGASVYQLLMGQTFEYGSDYAARLGSTLAIDSLVDHIEYLAS